MYSETKLYLSLHYSYSSGDIKLIKTVSWHTGYHWNDL